MQSFTRSARLRQAVYSAVAVLALGLSQVAAQGSGELVARLLALDSSESADPQALAVELSAHAQSDPGFVLAAAAGFVYDESGDSRALGARATQLASRTLEDLPVAGLRSAIATWEEPPEPVRLEALRRLGARGGPSDVELVIALATPEEGEELVPRSWRVAATGALAAIHARHPESRVLLARAYSGVHAGLLHAVVQAVGADATPESLAALSGMLGRAEGGDLLLLNQIARTARANEHAYSDSVRRSTRYYLESRDARIRQEAARVAGTLKDDEALPELLEMLEDSDGNVRWRAHEALQEIARLALPAEPDAWLQWYESQLDWWESGAEQLFSDLRSSDPAKVAAALKEVSRVRLFRRELAENVVLCLDRREESLVILSCAVLAHLAMPECMPSLVQHLEDRRGHVRVAAHQALVTLAGVDRGMSPDAWLGALNADS